MSAATGPAAVLVALLSGLVGALLCACSDEPAPRQSSEAFLERRRMSAAVVEIAETALTDDDPRKAAEAYRVLVDLWPDLPEARTGGAWRGAAARAERLVGFSLQLENQRRQGIALTDRLRATGQTLDELEAELAPVVVAPDGADTEPVSTVGRLTRALRRGTAGSATEGALR